MEVPIAVRIGSFLQFVPGVFLPVFMLGCIVKTLNNPQKAILIAADVGLGLIVEAARVGVVYGLYELVKYTR